MTPVLPQLDPVPMPGPPLLFWLLLMLTFTLHILAMNAVLGGSVIALAVRWAGGAGQGHHARLARMIASWMPVTIATAVTLGVAALLFLQVLYGRAFFPSSVLMARIWLSIVPLLIVAYYAAYATSMKKDRLGLARALTLAGAAIFAVIAFILSNNMGLMLRVEELPRLFAADARGLQLNTGDPSMIPRYLHMLFGAIATAGMIVALSGALVHRRDQPFGTWAIRVGTAWFAAATLLNFTTGLWWLGVLPQATLADLTGRHLGATIVLASAITILLVPLGLLVAATQARKPVPWVVSGAGLLVTGIVLMLLTRDFVRSRALEAAGFAFPSWVAPQWDLIALFLVLLAVAIATVAWMGLRLHAAFRAADAPEPAQV